MSFAEYLKGRISEDYRNLIIQKLEEIKGQTEVLKTSLTPSIVETQKALRATLQRELVQIQELLEAESSLSQESVASQIQSQIDENISSWYYSDISRFEQQLEILISDIVSNIPVPPRKESEELSSLSRLLTKLDQGTTQSEILNIVLHHMAHWVDRALLFVIRGDQASGWAALGLSSDWDANRVRQIKIDLNKNTILRDALNTGAVARGAAEKYADNGELFLMIGSTFPGATFACPVTVRGKIAGILYADVQSSLDENPDLPNLLYLAGRAAGFAIDLLPLKPKGAVAPQPAATPVEMPVPKQAAAPASVEVIEEVEEPEEIAEQAVEQAEPEEGAATVMMPAFAPPPPAPAPVSEEERQFHEDAKRFARLLVSEIKLYNEAQVAAGREHRDLYERLRDDIERSRRMYMERVPDNIHSATDYFYEELVKNLANGDPTLLGM